MNLLPAQPQLSFWTFLKEEVKNVLDTTTMLCCGRKKDPRDVSRQHIIGEGSAYPSLVHHHHHQHPLHVQYGRRPVQVAQNYQYLHHGAQQLGSLPYRTREMPEMVLQGDFRKVSGISNEIFRQIEAVENDFDETTAAYFDSVQKRGEMVIRILDPRTLGPAGEEACRKYLYGMTGTHSVQFIEIIKRPGQTLGLYIREEDGFSSKQGVFISRIALECAVYNSGLLKVGDEILAVNLVDVSRMSLDDVVIIMSIPRRLVLTIRSRLRPGIPPAMMAQKTLAEEFRAPPIVVVKQDVEEEPMFGDEEAFQRDNENGYLMHARIKGLPDDIPTRAVPLEGDTSMEMMGDPIYYNPRSGMPIRGPMHIRDDLWTNPRRVYNPIATPQRSLQRQYPRTLENLAQSVHQFYSSDVPLPSAVRSGSLQVTRAAVHRPPSAAYQHYWDDYSGPLTGSLSRNQRPMRARSDRIPLTMSDDFLDRYTRPWSRGQMRTPTGYSELASVMQDTASSIRQRRLAELESSSQAISSILRRRYLDGSASDTEVSSPSKPYYDIRQRSAYSKVMKGSPRDFQLRSSSLPRARTSIEYRCARASPLRMKSQPRQSVRFDKSFGYDEDSDGAVSAPELPPPRSRRSARRATSPAVYSSQEYRQWMGRAPSTSAIYESVRLARGLQPLSASSLSKIAHSAESLRDTIRMEQQKSLLSDLYASRPYVKSRSGLSTPISSLLREESLKSPLRTSPVYDYLRGSIPNPTPVKPTDDSRLHLLSLNPREFFKYLPEKPDSTSAIQEGFSGLLWVHLLAGRGLRASTGHENYRDVYCVIECDRIHKARTVVRSGEHSFDWDEIFELDMFDTKEVAFLLYTWDPQYRHKLCYKGVINLISLSLKETPVHSLALKMEPRGSLYVKLRYKDLHLTFQRTSPSAFSQVTSPLFGVDLETVVNRENAGLSVPLIIKRCVEEVHKRGLDLVGVYRLCGSSVRKNMLREAFEKNAWLVDLSMEHVPDINVITSLLKDYLRELPEPLFTKALFDMMEDGLSVCLPDDPSGNAKLMFSILECLPKVNRCTVIYLMDHLKLVLSHGQRNKMSSQSLATIFGPLFTCHSESETLHKPIEVFKFLLEIWLVRRMSNSCSGSMDTSMADKPMTSLSQPTQLNVLSTTISSSPFISTITSIAHPSVNSTTTTNPFSQAISLPPSTSNSMLPMPSALTPGPSPTAVASESGSTSASVTTIASEIEMTQPSNQPKKLEPPPVPPKKVGWANNNAVGRRHSGDNSANSGLGPGPGQTSSSSIVQRSLPEPPKC